MKKFMTLMMMFVMLFSFTLTAEAGKSASGEPVTDDGTASTPTSPKTGENEIVLYGLGMTAVILASGAVVVRKRTA